MGYKHQTAITTLEIEYNRLIGFSQPIRDLITEDMANANKVAALEILTAIALLKKD